MGVIMKEKLGDFWSLTSVFVLFFLFFQLYCLHASEKFINAHVFAQHEKTVRMRLIQMLLIFVCVAYTLENAARKLSDLKPL